MSDTTWSDFDPHLPRQSDRTRYRGAYGNVLYDRRRCMHAAECGRASSAVFDARRSPWIAPDEVEPAELERIVLRCPTGALQFERPDGAISSGRASERNEVTVSPDGPLYLRGRILAGGRETETRVALCRCGASGNKPWCDGSHAAIRFRDAGGVARDATDDDPGEGELMVVAVPDGPLILQGPLTIRAASGRPAMRGTKAALCRCGNSRNKPFCDGAHAREGFRSVPGDGR